MTNSELLERFRELEARLQKVNTELDGLRVAIKGRTFTEKKAETPTKVYEVGEYVRVKSYEDSDEFAGIVTERTETPKGFLYVVYGKDRAAIKMDADMIEKWIPKKGDLCIFWGNDRAQSSIGLFDSFYYSEERERLTFRNNIGTICGNCIPFISEEQFKEHIGYEE